MKELSGRELLKLMAQQAKNRMRGKNEKSKDYKVIIGGDRLEYKSIIIKNDDDEMLYDKVKEILSTDGEGINPIHKIIDIEKYNNLSGIQKEKYLFEITDKYRKLKERYITEISTQKECI